jgi:hypothetical protein
MTNEQVSTFEVITLGIIAIGFLATWAYLAAQLFWIGFKKRFTI